MSTIKNLQDVVDWGLCTGCGACYSACTEGNISLVNIESVGIRPKFTSDCGSCQKCLPICPGFAIDAQRVVTAPSKTEPEHEFGPVLEIWEGYAADPDIRFRASSGGLLSALSLYCLEQENMAFVMHTGMDEAKPWLNKTVQSKNRADILSRTGSRYAPASPCDSLPLIAESDRPCVFIGKPCDTAAVMAAREQDPKLDQNLGLVLSFFCAGTPSTKGTLDLIQLQGVATEDVQSVRYRGEGWPGRFKVRYGQDAQEKSLTYDESWGHLTSYRPMRCNLCPDGLGRVADLACGDAWENASDNGNPGISLVLVRSERGREILHRAMAAGYVHLEPANPQMVMDAQRNLLQRRRELFGRLLAFKLLLTPTTKFMGFSLFRSWARLPLKTQLKSFLGTLRRVAMRGLWRRRPLFS